MADAVAAVQFVETSAKDNINVDTAFREITKVNITARNYSIVVSTGMKNNCFKKTLVLQFSGCISECVSGAVEILTSLHVHVYWLWYPKKSCK